MRIFNKEKTQELISYDITQGYLKKDTLVTHYNKVDCQPEKAHYEFISGTKECGLVKKVVDSPAVEAVEEHDETEEIYVFIPYTLDELAKIADSKKLRELKAWFNTYFAMQLQQQSWQTDYIPSYDTYFKQSYADWAAVCAKANEVRTEIKNLEISTGISNN